MKAAPWFFAPQGSWGEREVVLPPDESRHALRVLRIAPPDVIAVTDGCGVVAICAAARVDDDRLVAEVLDREERRRPRPEIVVYQGAAKGHKLDDVVERLAELGIAELWAYESARSVVRWDKAKVDRLNDRWAAIARSAAKQSRNPYTIHARAGVSWTELLRRLAQEPLVIALWEEALLPLRTALAGHADRVALIVGPEGGLAAQEAEQLADAGAQLVSLGPQILRTENAPVIATSALLYHYGLIG
ncbi:MAG: 16S rRNA (uracil(1498)-N(3))-methyltransferase [Actinomycetota bacterium]|nr:16S rRNA (uracil(1498)-N(3))-methyltransferase [Actinomycetota bacterium]